MGYEIKYMDCAVCGKGEKEYIGRRMPRAFDLDKQLQADIVRCRSCGLFYPYPLPFAARGQLDTNFGDHEKYFPSAVSQARLRFYKKIMEKIEKFSPVNKGKLLDVGCGRGELLHIAKNKGWQACGVDVSANFAGYARDRFNVDVKVGEVRGMGFAAESFDVITLISSLDHTYDPKGLLLELNKLLKKRGVLFIEVMNSGSLLYKLGDLYYRLTGRKITTRLSPTFPSFQIYGFSPASITKALELCGYEIVKIWIRGGVSRNEKAANKTAGEIFLRSARVLCFILASILGKGHVMEVCARKKGD